MSSFEMIKTNLAEMRGDQPIEKSDTTAPLLKPDVYMKR